MQFEVGLLCRRCVWCGGDSLRRMAVRSSGSYYDLLGVTPDASVEQIKQAFFVRSKKLHPDSDPSNPGLHAQFVALSEAYRVLSRETSRREYDTQLRARHRHWDRQTHTAAPHYSSESSEHVRYSEQFRYAPPQDLSPDQLERKRKRNLRLVGYCMLAMIGSIVAHYFGFRKLEEMHNSFMEEKDRAITEIYNTSKERARVNGFQKQTAILRQKHAEFVEKYQRREERGTDDK